ncbi:MAG: TRAP transporter large permease [Candidatus Rokuibacteriota bacterium]
MIGTLLIGLMLLFLAAGIPIVFAIGLAALAGVLALPNVPLILIPNRMFSGMDSFPLMAIPFFLLAGEVMNVGGITVRIVRFANALVGHIRGGLAHANIVASMFFAGITGSALADAAAIGSIMIPAMKREGYDEDFSAAVTASAAIMGPIIPPSITMVIFGVTASVSIGALFLAGFVPGVLIALSLMAVAYVLARRRGYPRAARVSARELAVRLKDAALALLTPVIILGGILGGVMTPTEAAAVAVFYALFLGIYVFRTLAWRQVPGLLLRTGVVTGFIMVIVGTASVFAWLLATEQVPQHLSRFFLSISREPWVVLLVVNVFLLVVGCLMDTSAAIIILVPVLLPLVTSVGIDPLHFGLVMCVNLVLGMATPPFGVVLFLVSNITKLSIERLVRAMWPFLLVEVAVLFLITYVPDVALWVPRLFGLAR